VPVEITLRPYTVDILAGLSRHRGRDVPDLLTEAAVLEVDRAAADARERVGGRR
jgi:hypothetical protein